MRQAGSHPRARRALLLLPAAATATLAPLSHGAPVQAELTPYAGTGYVRTLSQDAAVGAAFFDYGGDGVLDLVTLDSASNLTVHEKCVEYDRRSVIEGVSAFAVTHGSSDRVFGLMEGGLVEITGSGDFGWDTAAIEVGVLSSASLLRSASRPLGPRLLMVDRDGLRARVLDPENNFAVLAQHNATAAEGVIHDLAVLDWNGDDQDELALVTTIGLRVYNSQDQVIAAIDGDPTGAFVDVLAASGTQWGRDLLFYQYREESTDPTVLVVVNDQHAEMIFANDFLLPGVAFADVAATPLPELILPCGSTRAALIGKQFATASPAAPIFGIDWNDVNLVDLSLGEASTPQSPPVTAVADADQDGDEDVLFADDRGLGMLVASEWLDADLLRAPPQSMAVSPRLEEEQSVWSFQYDLALDVPAGASAVDIEIWFQPDAEVAVLEPSPVFTDSVPAQNPSLLISFPVTDLDGIYYLLTRPVSSGGAVTPVWVGVWSPDLEVNAELLVHEGAVYPWRALEDAPGGITRRPMIDPGMGTGYP